MNWRRHILETLTLVVAAVVCASVANLLAARERKVAFVGSYKDALAVPQAPPEAPPVPPAPAASNPSSTAAAAPSGAPAGPPLAPEAAGVVTKPPAERSAAVPSPRTPAAAAAPRVSNGDLLSRFPQHKDKPFVEITGDDVAYLHRAGALVLDARRTGVYEEGHIAGARPISVWESDADEKVTALVGEGRDTSQPVVLYCSGGDCEDSHMLAQKLWGAGFENLLVYRDGFPDWKKRNGAIHTGPQP